MLPIEANLEASLAMVTELSTCLIIAKKIASFMVSVNFILLKLWLRTDTNALKPTHDVRKSVSLVAQLFDDGPTRNHKIGTVIGTLKVAFGLQQTSKIREDRKSKRAISKER
ncbi:MAG: hypothetical protein AB8B99_00965 [Phormidesmis sp.]